MSRDVSAVQVAVFGTARRPYFFLAIISVTVQLWIYVFWVISVYFNIRNTLPKSGTFLLGHPVQSKPKCNIVMLVSIYKSLIVIVYVKVSVSNCTFQWQLIF